MCRIGKTLALLITLTIITSCLTLLTVKSTNGQIIPTSTIPQFTAKFVNSSYTETTTNSYTGQSQTQQINNNSIEITIKNQPFNYSNNGLPYQLYYNVRTKPHFSNAGNWTEVYPLYNLTSSRANANGIYPYAWYIYSPVQSNSTTTTIDFKVAPDESTGATGYDVYGTAFSELPIGSQLDFQVEALVGHNSTYWHIRNAFDPDYGSFSVPAIAWDSASGWSSTQTVTIGEVSTPPNNSQSDNQEFTNIAFIIVVAVLALVIVSLLVYVRRIKRRLPNQ